MRILVTGATGHIGSRIIDHLLGRADVSIFMRDARALSDGVRSRVQVHTGAMEDAAALKSATAGVDAMFFMVPPNMKVTNWSAWMNEVGANGAEAAKANHVGQVVLLSSVGAERQSLGPITFLGHVETIFRAIVPNLTILRPAYFMENLLQSVGSVRDASTMFNVFSPEWRFPMIATRDIAAFAAKRLLDSKWSGQSVQGLHGPADVSMPDAGKAIGAALGKTVEYVTVPYDAAAAAMRSFGLSDAVVAGYMEMNRGMATLGLKLVTEADAPQAATTTSITEFARAVFAPAVLGEPVGA
jgi:uncharacterized protein YbjT (DUF2867 family)